MRLGDDCYVDRKVLQKILIQILCKDTSLLANFQQNLSFFLILPEKRQAIQKRGEESFGF